MNREKYFSIVKSLVKSVLPGTGKPSPTGGTTFSRYCYSTWLRHLQLLHKHRKQIPSAIVELGPGDSPGTGMAALLSGCEKYIALDTFRYGSNAANVKIFDELVELFKSRTPLPGKDEFPFLIPYIDDHSFPHDILTEELLSHALNEERISAIRKEIEMPAASNEFIKYIVPWKPADIDPGTIDFIFSQSVLEYVDPAMIFATMHNWLRPAGMMAHVVDFSSIGMTSAWNGHWAYSPLEWKLFCLGNSIRINRAPVSVYTNCLVQNGFRHVDLISYQKQNGLKRNELAKPFRDLPDDDLNTHAAYLLAEKIG